MLWVHDCGNDAILIMDRYNNATSATCFSSLWQAHDTTTSVLGVELSS
jgi:hypothetical protein